MPAMLLALLFPRIFRSVVIMATRPALCTSLSVSSMRARAVLSKVRSGFCLRSIHRRRGFVSIAAIVISLFLFF